MRRWVKKEGYANPGELGGVFGEYWPRHGQLSSGGVNAQVKLKAERTPGIFGTRGNLNFSFSKRSGGYARAVGLRNSNLIITHSDVCRKLPL